MTGGPQLVSIAILLAGCTAGAGVSIQPPNSANLETLVTGDLASSQALAAAAQDDDGQRCWVFLQQLAAKWPQTVGAATLIELKRIPHTGAFTTACQATLLSGAIPSLLTPP